MENSAVGEKVDKDVVMFENWRRMRFTQRCNNFPKIAGEDVAQHSCFVAQLSIIIADELNDNADFFSKYGAINVECLVRKALFHDMPESFTSDIPYNVKHHSKEISEKINDVEKALMDEVFQGTSYAFASYRINSSQAKTGLEGKVLGIADMLELAWYCYEEVTMGNKFMRGLLDKAIKITDGYELTKYSNFVMTALNSLSLSNLVADIHKRLYI